MSFQELKPFLEKKYALTHAMGLLSFDKNTVGIKKARPDTVKTMSYLKKELLELNQSTELYDVLKSCCDDSSCTMVERKIAEEWKRLIDESKNVPTEIALKYAKATNRASTVWPGFKHKNDFASFAPYLEDVISNIKEIAKLKQKKGQTLYDVLINDYLPGFNVENLDDFFGLLKKKIVPLIKEISTKEKIKDVLIGNYDIETQKEYVRNLIGRLNFDFESGDVFESEHPFTTHFNCHDVRFTNKFHEDNLHAVFSGMHETGHALYEMGISEEISHTPIGQGASTPMHEGQSRFYENMIGRNPIFWENEYKNLQKAFAIQFKDIELNDFLRSINKVEPGLIRIMADELTYSLHIMLRYEIEKEMINNDIAISDLPSMWNAKTKEFLGLDVTSDAEGVLQDMHWGSGLIGYFPGYSLGSAIAAQIYHALKEKGIEKDIQEENFKKINDYLKENIYQYGKTYTSDELLERVTGEKFNPNYYVDYLTEKFKKLYNIS